MTAPDLVGIPCGTMMIEGFSEIPKNPEGLVLFAHGSGSSRYSPRNNYVASVLRKAGMGTLLLDLLTRDEEEDTAHRFDIGLLTERLVTAARWAKGQPATRHLPLGLFGASTGAAAAIEAAALLGPEVMAVVSRGGRPDLASVRALAEVAAPTLLIVGGFDTEVIVLNREAYERLGCEKELIIVPGVTHLFEEPGTLEQVATMASGWFSRHLSRRA